MATPTLDRSSGVDAAPVDSAADSAVDSAAAERIARRLARLAPEPGIHTCSWPGLEILRADHPHERTPVVYQPCICVVAQGRKRAHLGGEAFDYDPLHYLVLSVPLPIEGEIVEASRERPFLALRLQLEARALGELVLEAGEAAGPRGHRKAQPAIYISPLGEALTGAVDRLLAALDDPADRKVLAPMAERELLYRVLTGAQGEKLREVALRDSRSHRVSRVVRFLNSHFEESLDIATIASVANMSPSTLHHAFKEVTSTSPLQYLKSVRLHQARLLMLQDGLGAGEAAHRVGYGSDSQFSREYRRLFGAPPSRDVAELRRQAEAPATG